MATSLGVVVESAAMPLGGVLLLMAFRTGCARGRRRSARRFQSCLPGFVVPPTAPSSRLDLLPTTPQGLLKHLEESTSGGAEAVRSRGVVIGYDHRKAGSISSERFAVVAAQACALRGVKAFVFSRIVATPLVPFSVAKLGAAAGIMVTASHNPKEDNGYKVYWGNAAQIIPPVDAGIAAAIEKSLEPWDAAAYRSASTESVRALELVVDPDAEFGIVGDYLGAVAKQSRAVAAGAAAAAAANGSAPPVVYTAMHGVGTPFVLQAFEAFGHPAPILVKEQCDPDPLFPTVAFPNPEEGKGALERSFATAEAAGATLVLANDPDADRLAVAERRGSAADGDWYVFSGNEIGCLLADWLLRCEARDRGKLSGGAADGTDDAASLAASLSADLAPLGDDVYVLATTVSSKAIRAVAHHYGAKFTETLTGFKWIGNVASNLRAGGAKVVLGVEEAIGFCVSDVVLDKDGVCAAAVFAEMAASLARCGQTCLGRLEQLREATGYFVSCNKYLRVTDSSTVDAIFARLRNGGRYALCMGEFVIQDVRDLTGAGLDTSIAGGKPALPTSSSHMVTISFRNSCVVTLRTSGTEPKLKWYAELRGDNREQARAEMAKVMDALFDFVLTPEAFGLARPEVEIIG